MTSVPATGRHRGGQEAPFALLPPRSILPATTSNSSPVLTFAVFLPSRFPLPLLTLNPSPELLRSVLPQRAVKSENAESVSDIFIGPIVLEHMTAPPPRRIRLSHCPQQYSLAPSSQLRRSRIHCCHVRLPFVWLVPSSTVSDVYNSRRHGHVTMRSAPGPWYAPLPTDSTVATGRSAPRPGPGPAPLHGLPRAVDWGEPSSAILW
jgi:hypothetical protein